MNAFDIFKTIDLDYPGLQEVKAALETNERQKAEELLFNYFMNRNNVGFYMEDYMEDVANYCKENFPSEVENIIRVAEEVKQQTFLFRFKWDMERTNKPVTFHRRIVWDKAPFDDEEWVFMLNRHRYWIALGQAYAITGDEACARTFFNQLEDWIDNNPRREEACKTTWRTIEAGIRCENWLKAFMYFRKSKTLRPEIMFKMLASLHDHVTWLHQKYDNFRRLSNWGVLENHGMFTVSVLFPELKHSRLFLQDSIKRLTEEINLQVMRDGTHWEQSPMYHNEVLHCYLDTIILANKNNVELTKDIMVKTKALAYADLYMAKPNHHQPMQSDSDDTDLRDMITKAALVFKDGQLKFGGCKHVDFESIWDLGMDSISEYDNIQAEEPQHASYGFNDSGNYYMRSGWGEKDNYMHFHCGTLGSGHGHSDLLHFDLHGCGESILTDSGRYTYVEGSYFRNYFKSCSAHNTTMVDDKEFTVCMDSWRNSKAAVPIKQNFLTDEEFDYVEGGHLGYMDLDEPVHVARKILFIKPDCWVVADEFHGEGTHQYKQLFHFDNGEIIEEANDVIFQGKRAKLRIMPLNKHVKKETSKCLISKEYNQMEDSNQLVLSLENKGFTSMITILNVQGISDDIGVECKNMPVFRGDGKPVGYDEAEAVKIMLNDKEEHVVLVAHGEAFKGSKLYVVDGVPVYGKVVIIKRKDGNETVVNVRY